MCLFAGAAYAADLGGAPRRSIKDDPIPYAPVRSWTGLYVGTHAGYAWSDNDWQDALGSSSHEGSGWLAGGQIGYNWQLNQLVIGAEADASSTWVDGSASCAGGGTCSQSYNWLASVRGRAGVAVNENRTLLYGTAGFAWAITLVNMRNPEVMETLLAYHGDELKEDLSIMRAPSAPASPSGTPAGSPARASSTCSRRT